MYTEMPSVHSSSVLTVIKKSVTLGALLHARCLRANCKRKSNDQILCDNGVYCSAKLTSHVISEGANNFRFRNFSQVFHIVMNFLHICLDPLLCHSSTLEKQSLF